MKIFTLAGQEKRNLKLKNNRMGVSMFFETPFLALSKNSPISTSDEKKQILKYLLFWCN